MNKVINTSQCEKCESGSVDDTDKARVKVFCSSTGKTYYYGQCVHCDSYKKRKEE